MKINISEKKGELSFGIFWVSLDGRMMFKWFQTKKLAFKQYIYLKTLKRQPSFIIRIEEEDLK